MQSITLAQASTIIDVALKTGRDNNFMPLVVAVLDAGGHLVAYKREDKSGILRFEIAYGKAWGALGMGLGSRTLAGRAPKQPAFFTVARRGQRRPPGAGPRRGADPRQGRRHHRRMRHFRRRRR